MLKKLMVMVLLGTPTLSFADASSCNFISDDNSKNYCIAVAKKDASYCSFITDENRKNMCIAIVKNEPSYCGFITNSDQRNNCLGQAGS
ncbi:MAG: hypothetical protein WCK80_04195 [bacterium]